MRKILVQAYNEINAEVISEAWNQAIEQDDLLEEVDIDEDEAKEEVDIDEDDTKEEEGSDDPQEENETDNTDYEIYNNLSDEYFYHMIRIADDNFAESYKDEEELLENRRNPKCIEKPIIFPKGGFDLSKARNLLSVYEVAANRNIDVSELNEYARTLTSSLVLNVSNDREYRSRIKELASHLPQSPNGTHVSVITHSGDRVERKFHETELGRNLYIYVASSEYLIRDHLFLGEFIIIHADGTEVDPNELLSIPFSKTLCFNVRPLNW